MKQIALHEKTTGLMRVYRARFERWLIPKLIRLAAYPGTLKLQKKAPLRVLIDNSVLRHGQTHTNAWIATGIKLWGNRIPVETGYSARVPREPKKNQTEIYEQEIPYLAALAYLGRTGHINFYTSHELAVERWRQPHYEKYRFGLNLWRKVQIEMLPRIPGSSFLSSAMTAEWYTPESQTDRLIYEADPAFKKLIPTLPKAHLLDLYHLWTAMHHNCPIFLTTDKKLKRVMAGLPSLVRDRFAKVEIMFPSELGARLRLVQLGHRILTPLDSDWFCEIR